MRKTIIVAALILISTAARAEDGPRLFFGLNGGFNLRTGTDGNAAIGNRGAMWGLSVKGVGDEIGLAYTGLSASHGDNEDVAGTSEGRHSFHYLDLLIRYDRKNEDFVKYVLVFAGVGKEKLRAGSESGEFIRDIWGIGVGAFERPQESRKVLLGGEARYAILEDSESASGAFQMYVSLLL